MNKILVWVGVAGLSILLSGCFEPREDGNGTQDSLGGPVPFLGVLAPDPGPGGLALALTYDLGTLEVVAGDLILLEPGTDLVSEVIRFNPVGTGGNPTATLVFYSDVPAGDETPALADTGFPTESYTNVVRAFEVGSEGSNGFTYIPTDGQPGFITGFPGLSYVIVSDGVPEPATLALLGLGIAGLGFSRRRKSN